MNPLSIDGAEYYTVKQFARKTYRSEQSVRFLISKGNRLRKLKCVYFAGKPFIPVTELTEYPFTLAGRQSRVFHYNTTGVAVYDD